MKDKSQLYEECKRRYKLKELTSRKAAELCQIPQADIFAMDKAR